MWPFDQIDCFSQCIKSNQYVLVELLALKMLISNKGDSLMMDLEYTILSCRERGTYRYVWEKSKHRVKKKWGKCSYPFNILWIEHERTARLFDILEVHPGNLAKKTCWHCKLVEWPLRRIKMLHIALVKYFSFCLLSLINLWEIETYRCNLHLYP